MVETFNDPSDIQSRLNFLSRSFDDDDLAEALETAHRKLESMVGRHIQEELRPDRISQETYRLAFSDIEKFVLVDQNDESVDSSNYTTEAGTGEIVFDSDYVNQEMENRYWSATAVYVPTIFKDLELYLALKEVLNLVAVQTQDDDVQLKYEQWSKQVENLKDSINKTTAHLSSPTRGDRVAANQIRTDWIRFD